MSAKYSVAGAGNRSNEYLIDHACTTSMPVCARMRVYRNQNRKFFTAWNADKEWHDFVRAARVFTPSFGGQAEVEGYSDGGSVRQCIGFYDIQLLERGGESIELLCNDVTDFIERKGVLN